VQGRDFRRIKKKNQYKTAPWHVAIRVVSWKENHGKCPTYVCHREHLPEHVRSQGPQERAHALTTIALCERAGMLHNMYTSRIRKIPLSTLKMQRRGLVRGRWERLGLEGKVPGPGT